MRKERPCSGYFWRYVNRVLLLLLPLACLFPFIFLAVYTNPNAEDFSHSFLPKTAGAFYSVLDFYKNKEARLFTNMLYAYNPLKYGFIDAYKLLPVTLIMCTIFSMYFFLKRIIIIRELRNHVFFLTLLIFCVFLSGMPSPVHAFYWMSSSFNYTVPLVFFFILLSMILKGISGIRNGIIADKKRLFVLVLLIFVIVLSNEIYILFLSGFFFTWCMYARITRKREAGLLATLGSVSLLASALYLLPHFLMPEISHGRISVNSHLVFEAIRLSFYNTFKNLISWALINPSLILLSLLFFLVLINLADFLPKLKGSFVKVNTLFFIPFVILMLVVLVFPYFLFRDPTHEPQRIYNVQYILFLTAWFYMLTSIFINRKSERKAYTAANGFVLFMVTAALTITLIFSKNISTAYHDVFSGVASAYNKEMNERFEIIRKSQQEHHRTAVVKELQNHPATIFFPPDLLADTAKTMWHEAYEKYFNLKHIIVLNPEHQKYIPDAKE